MKILENGVFREANEGDMIYVFIQNILSKHTLHASITTEKEENK